MGNRLRLDDIVVHATVVGVNAHGCFARGYVMMAADRSRGFNRSYMRMLGRPCLQVRLVFPKS